MKSRPSRHILALVSLLVFLLTGQAAAQGYVWCLGEDGHAALEYAASTSCRPAPVEPCRDGHAGGMPGALAGDEHCGPCLDIPAVFDAARRPAQSPREYFPPQAGPAARVEISRHPRCVPLLTADLQPQPPPRISQAILAHRTVVLLN